MATIISRSPEETMRAGREVAATLKPGEVLALAGDLGAGKTHFVKGLAAGLGADDAVTSPTFTLIHEYTGGRIPLYHIDLYRLETAGEVESTGLDDYLGSGGIAAIEWADKFPEFLENGVRWIRFGIGEGDTREITVEEPT